MANLYSNHEMADMHFIYGKANGSATKAARLYREAYPDRRQPSSKMFVKIHQRLCEIGTFQPSTQDYGRPRSVSTAELEERVLVRIEEEPELSCRRIAHQEGIQSHTTIWKILRNQLLYPYHLQRVQALVPADFHSRTGFCQWLMNERVCDPMFVSKILFTDEASFSRDGINNFHNNHIWAEENPHATLVSNHRSVFG